MIIESPLLGFHHAAGVEFSPYFGVNLPAQFGDPRAEYRCGRQSAALVDTNFRSVFSFAGPDRARYLNAVLTSNVRDLANGAGTIGLLLNAQGHILAELESFALEDRILVLGHACVREKTAEVLEKFIIMDDVTLTDETAEMATIAIEGPAAPEIVQRLAGVELANMGVRAHAAVNVKTASRDIACRVIRRSLFDSPGGEFLAAREELPALWGALASAVRASNGAPIGYRALNTLRLEAGIPWFGTDFDERQIPHEAALENTHISYTKGCYTGQEIVERVRSRGHVNRRRVGLQFETPTPPEPGATLHADGAEVGNVTSAAFSELICKPIGMGYARGEHNAPGTVLTCGDATTQVIELPVAPQKQAAITAATSPGDPPATPSQMS